VGQANALSWSSSGASVSRLASPLGPGRLSALEADLRAMVPGETFRLDVPGWFGG